MKTTRYTTPPDTTSHLAAPRPGREFHGISFANPGYRVDVKRRGPFDWTGQLLVGPRGIRLYDSGRSGTPKADPADAMKPTGWTPVGPQRTFLTRRRAHERMTEDLALVQRAHHELTHSVVTIHATDPKDPR
jgi:hypothetical protein